MTSSRQSARPIATRSLIWRTFGSRSPAARTGAERSASKRRATARRGTGRRRVGSGRTRAKRRQRPTSVQPCTRIGPFWPPGTTLSRECDLAYVFPGQGSQSVGMGRTLAETSPAAAAVFAAADAALGESADRPRLGRSGRAARPDREGAAGASSPRRWPSSPRCASAGPPPACAEPRPRFAAGHSMGQYSALVAAGALSLDDGIRLVRERGRLMQGSSGGRDGAMAALIGLDDARLPELVAQASAHGVFVVANRNAPGQVVVSGERPAVEAGAEIAKALGREARDRPARLGRGPLAAHGRRGRGHARRPRRRDLPRSRAAAAGQRRRPADHDRRRPAAPSSSST